ncbi:hypothetical protein MVEN_00361600 [Mycena venus]|uniref:Large ribosomal subunit protein uL30-like ferredoxin-like fold domain-containing protein n=1 Tax=Mycena venus TaxID=2733690 RepID=A0A8H6YV76_9AGAR|nr:hypothetical protein MVEN_00361600 [Mycena venus]
MDPTSTRAQKQAETLTHKGFAAAPDPFAPRRRPGASFFNALLATALFRCWHILVFFVAWSTLITILDHHRDQFKVRIASTLLTVVGTVLGFVVSYRTTSSFERYNEGRRFWSQIFFANRTFARTVWFHVPDQPPTKDIDEETYKSRGMVEKKTIINLLEAFSVAVKHYLRGEDGIYYQDLYYLVKFLPAYALPAGIPSNAGLTNGADVDATGAAGRSPILTRLPDASHDRPSLGGGPGSFLYQRQASANSKPMSAPHLPLPATSPTGTRHTFTSKIAGIPEGDAGKPIPPPLTLQPPTRLNSPVEKSDAGHGAELSSKSLRSMKSALTSPLLGEAQKIILTRQDESFLLPGSMPPKYHLFDLFPFSLLVKCLTKRGAELKGKKAARIRARMWSHLPSVHPRALSRSDPCSRSLTPFYSEPSSYIAALQNRKQIDAPTTTTLLASLNNLVDALTGLERILTTPIPFSQIVETMGWQTIPATSLLTFIFFGFLVAGEEIENPFGYEKNDLNLDHFTHNIIRNELRAITSAPAPNPDRWRLTPLSSLQVFSPENDLLFASDMEHDERVGPNEWVRRGSAPILEPSETHNTHFKITVRRSAISLEDKKSTLAALGLHRRNQTVFHPHRSDVAGKILEVKELLEVQNVPASEVRKLAQHVERKTPKGFQVVGSRMGSLDGI